MVRRKSQKAQELDIQVTEAVLGVQSGKYKSAYAAAKALGLCKDTVLKRVKGGLTRQEAHQRQQLLSAAQEKTLLKWINGLTISGYAPTHCLLREIADEIRTNQCRVFEPTQPFEPERIPNFPLGQDWVPRFIQRHPHLKVRSGRRIEAQRIDGVTVPVVNAWFDAVKDILVQKKIDKKDIYNMDETGFSIGTMESTRVIVDSTLRTHHQAHPGRQEWVSIVECICADGTVLKPLVIFKGQNVLQSWIPEEVVSSTQVATVLIIRIVSMVK
jgi:Tc5 transposase DNA-binding domain